MKLDNQKIGRLTVTPEMKKPMIKMLIGLGILFGGILAYQLFKNHMMKKYILGGGAPPVTVSALKATEETWDPRLVASGSIRAMEGVNVTTQITGMITDIHFQPGAEVKKDQPLLQLSSTTEIAQLHALEAAAELARINLTRDKAQFEIQAVSQSIVDTDLANVKNTQAQVDQQQSILDKKSIKAPFSGRLGIRLVNLGQFLNPGDSIVSLQRLDPIYVDFYLPQHQFVQARVGHEVRLVTDAFPGKVFKGKITTLNPIVDDTSRNGLVEATIANPKLQLLPGMFGTVEVHLDKPFQQITVPQTTITYNAYGEIAYIIREAEEQDKGKRKNKDKSKEPTLIAHQTFVKVGETRGDQIAVLSGIKAGDLVVTSGQMKLRNGSKVIINNTVEPANNPSPKLADEE